MIPLVTSRRSTERLRPPRLAGGINGAIEHGVALPCH
jgi:hypothetical protein